MKSKNISTRSKNERGYMNNIARLKLSIVKGTIGGQLGTVGGPLGIIGGPLGTIGEPLGTIRDHWRPLGTIKNH